MIPKYGYNEIFTLNVKVFLNNIIGSDVLLLITMMGNCYYFDWEVFPTRDSLLEVTRKRPLYM